MSDLFVAGSETTSSTLRWFAIFMADNPEAQQKAQKEIDEVVPRDTLPALEHKDQWVAHPEHVNQKCSINTSLVTAEASHTGATNTDKTAFASFFFLYWTSF